MYVCVVVECVWWVCACMCMCVHACVHACMYVHACVPEYAHICVCDLLAEQYKSVSCVKQWHFKTVILIRNSE